MKSIKFRYLITILGIGAASVILPSCKKYLDVNTDPNNSATSAPGLELTTAELYTGNSIGDATFIQTADWAQYYTGGPGVALGDFDKNTMGTSDGNQCFNNMYRSLSNLDYIIKKTGQPVYGAVAKVLSAYQFQVAVDLFGDVPFIDALKGDINDGFITSPKYDNAKDVVYPGIENLLIQAIASLDSANNQLGNYADPSLLLPGSDDLIYGGDLGKWNKFANSLLLKLYIREGTAEAQTKFAALEGSATFDFIGSGSDPNSDNSAITSYTNKPGGANPFWTDAQSSLGNFYVGSKTTIDYLTGTNDPRIDYFFQPNNDGVHVGLKQGDIENSPPSNSYSEPSGAKTTTGGIIYSPSAPVVFMSSWETYLLLAEAGALGWTSDDPKTFYDAAVTSNAAYLDNLNTLAGDYNGATQSLDMTTYLATPGQGAFDANNAIKSIAVQKWVSMDGLQPIEGWIETRRYDNAAHPFFASPGGLFEIPTQNVLNGSNFPSILYYPQTEASLNKNFPGQHVLTDKVFWDN